MRYDAVLAYAQVEHPTFGSFRLPGTMPEEPSPDNTVVVRRRGHGRRWRGRKRRRVQAQASSPLPPLIHRAESASDHSNGDEDDNNDDDDGVPRLQGQKDEDDGDAGNTDDDDTDNVEVVVGRTEAKVWRKVTQENLRAGRRIDPIPYTPREGDSELFDAKISEEDLKGLIDENGDLRYHRVHEWLSRSLARRATGSGLLRE